MFFYQQFVDALARYAVQCELVKDLEYLNRFSFFKGWSIDKKKFDDVLERYKPDVVLIDKQSILGLRVIEKKIPLFFYVRGDVWEEIQLVKKTNGSVKKRVALWHNGRITDKCFRGANLVLSISKYLEGVIKKQYPNKPSEVIPISGREPLFWHKVDGTKLKHPNVGLLQSANIWGKTKEMLTLTRVIESMPDVTFYWVGDGPYRDKILPVLSKYDNFKWLGKLEYPDQVREYLSDIDVYALISGMDTFGQTIIEALLMERPVIATNVGGIPEIIKNGETGFLVSQSDYNSIIEKISILINDKQKAQQMGQAGRHFVEEDFNWDKIAKRFADIMHRHL